MDDLHAIQRIQRGDPRALAVLVGRYQTRAVRIAFAITQDRQQAEDVVQTVFVSLLSSLRTFDLRRPFAPWFYKSVVNAAVRSARRTRSALSLDAVVNAETGDTFEDLLPDMAALPIDQVESEDVKALVQAALTRLTPEQRAVIVMRYYLDLSTHQISAQLATPPATIRWRLHSALKRLRGLLPALNEG